MAGHHFTMLVIMVTSTLPSTSSERNTVIHHVRSSMALHHFTLLVVMVTSTLPSTSSERNTVIHHVRTMMARHHFTMLVVMVTSTLPSTSSERNTVIHHVRTMMATTPLHYACDNGHLNIAQYLIREEHCNPSCENNDGETPLHYACDNGHLNIAQYLIREEHCNPSCENNNGDTPLHRACFYNHAHIVQYLLSTGRVNPLTKDKSGHTALYFASSWYDIIKLFQPFKECRTAFPVHTFTKLILTGDSGAGKTTITELIVRLASSTAVECVADVQRLTAGIVPHHIQSEQLGNFVVYDFAGQQEYYSSHAAVLEQVMRRSAAMFLCVVDLSESKEKICESLHYWLSFIDNACSTAEGRSHVVIVGSHADQVTSSVGVVKGTSIAAAVYCHTCPHHDGLQCSSLMQYTG